jgi:MFS family permease
VAPDGFALTDRTLDVEFLFLLRSRNVLLLLVSMLLATVPAGYLQVVLPLYLNRAGLEPSLIGLLYSLSGLVTAGLVVFSGALADRFGRRRFLIAGTALPIVSYVIFASTSDPPWLVAASVLGGVGLANGAAGAMTIASFDAMLAEHTSPSHRTTVFSWAQALWSLALGLGAVCAGLPEWLRQTHPEWGDLGVYRPPFVGVIVLAVIATLILLPLAESATEARNATARSVSWLPRRSVGVIARYAVALGLFGRGLGVAVQLMPLWLALRFGVDEAALGPWFGAAQVLSLSSVFLAPWFERRIGGPMAVLVVHVVGGVCLIAIALVLPVFEVAAIALVVRSVLANIAWPLQQSLLMTSVVPEERATAAGVGFAVWGLANAVGPALAGIMLQNGSLALPLLLGSVGYIIGGIAFGVGFLGVLPFQDSGDGSLAVGQAVRQDRGNVGF